MKACRVLLAWLLCLVLVVPAACADGIDSKWTLGNVHVEADGEEFLLGPQARLSAVEGEGTLALHFEIGLGENVHLPMSAELSLDTLNFSIGRSDRVYSMDTAVLMEMMGIGEEGKLLLQQIPVVLEAYGTLENKSMDAQYLKQYDGAFSRMYEILVNGKAEDMEVTVEDKVLPAKCYKGEMKMIHIVDMIEYLRNCGVPEFEAFATELLRTMNTAANREYIVFSSHYYDLKREDILPDENYSFGTLELIVANDGEVIYQKSTVSQGEDSVTSSESIYRPDRSSFTETVTEKDEERDYYLREEMRAEITGAITAIESIHLEMDSAVQSRQVQSYANRNLIVREVTTMVMDAAHDDGLWSGSMDMAVDTQNSYDYGDGPQMLTDKISAKGSYSEKQEEDGSITGTLEMDVDLDGMYTAAISCDLNRGSGAQAKALTGENSNVYALTGETTDVGYKLLQADAFSLMAEAVELYADKGLNELINYFNEPEDAFEWPEELGEDVEAQYKQYYNEQWWTEYSYSDAGKIYTGGMPQYSAPEGSVFESINVGAHNMVIHYLNDAGDFQIDITYMENGTDGAESQNVVFEPEDFTYCEEEDRVTMAYHYNGGDTLVFFTFEDADRQEAEDIIAGLQLKPREGGLVA